MNADAYYALFLTLWCSAFMLTGMVAVSCSDPLRAAWCTEVMGDMFAAMVGALVVGVFCQAALIPASLGMALVIEIAALVGF